MTDILSKSSEYTFNIGATNDKAIVRLDDTRYCIAYHSAADSGQGRAVIATVSEDTIAFGDEYTFNDVTYTHGVSIAKLDATHVCVVSTSGLTPSQGIAVVGTISGNTISFGTKQYFNTGDIWSPSVVALDSTHICVSFSNTSDYGTGVIGTISGNSISWGSEYTFSAATARIMAITKLDSTHVCVAYHNVDNPKHGKVVVGTITGSTISWGSEQTFNSDATGWPAITTLSATSICVAFQDTNDDQRGKAIIGTLSAGTFSWGSPVNFSPASRTDHIRVTKLNDNHIGITYQERYHPNQHGVATIGTISGNSISFGNKYVFNDDEYTTYIVPTTIEDDSMLVIYLGAHGKAVILNHDSVSSYIRPGTVSELYNYKWLRGKAKEGYVRPTVTQFYMSVPDYLEVVANPTYTDNYRTTSVVPMTTALNSPEDGSQRNTLPENPTNVTLTGFTHETVSNVYYLHGNKHTAYSTGATMKFNINNTDLLRIITTRDSAANQGGSAEVFINNSSAGTFTFPINSTLTKGLVGFQILNLNPNREHSVEIRITEVTGASGFALDVIDIDEAGSFLPWNQKNS